MAERPEKQYPCKCCGFYTLTDSTTGSYEICSVCFWEDDPVQNEDPWFEGGANAVSLLTARDNYVRFGACEPEFSDRVRGPVVTEVPPPFVVCGLAPIQRDAVLRRIKTLLLGIARSILSGDIEAFDGCAAIAAVAFPLDEPELSESLLLFNVVAREVDELLTGNTQRSWPEATVKEAALYEQRIRADVETACRLLETRLTAQLTAPMSIDL